MKAVSVRWLLLVLLQSFYHPSSGQYSSTCPPLTAPEHGSIIRCTNHERHLSVCTTTCDYGYDLHGSSRILCWCGGGFCGWRGIKPSCKPRCDTPDFEDGQVRFVDQWPGGFAGVIELRNVPDLDTKLTTGWSIALIFDRPLGKTSTVSCWNAKIVSVSEEHTTLTLINTQHNANLANYLQTPTIRWAFIVDGVQGSMPEAAYVALYNRQINDASCLKPRKMPEIQTIHVSGEETQEEKELEHPGRFSTPQTTPTPTPSTIPTTTTQTTTIPTTAALKTTTPTIPITTTPTTTTPATTVPTTTTPITTIPTTTTPTTTTPITTTATTTTPTTTVPTTTTPTTTVPTTTIPTTTIQKTTTPTTTTPTTTIKTTTTVKKSPPVKKPVRPLKRKVRRRRKRIKKPTTTPTQVTTTTVADDPQIVTIGSETNDTVLGKVGERFCKLQTDPSSYKTQDGWEDHGIPFFSGNAILTVEEHLLDWSMLIVFDSAIAEVQVWSCSIVDQSADGRMWTFGPHSWNLELYPGKSDINFIAKQAEKTPSTPTAKVYLCSYAFLEGDAIIISPNSAAQLAHERGEPPSTHPPGQVDEQENNLNEDDVEDIIDIPRWKKPKKTAKRCQPTAPNGIVPKTQGQIVLDFKPNNDGTRYNYNEVLHKSILFYETQRAGKLPKNNRIPWRGDSTLKDGCDIGVDLSGGWFDAGDHVKFHFPMACSITMLAWGGTLFRDAYEDAGELSALIDSIKWPLEYLIRSHISKYEFVGQVGSGKIDHVTYGRPEEMRMPRPTYIIDPEHPGTELAAEAAAAFAASHEFFKSTHPRLSKKCLKHAKDLFEFADKFRGEYHNAIEDVQDFYFSFSGYNDELIWAAAWMYRVTGDTQYLLKAKGIYLELGGQYAVESEFSWDRKLIGAQILLANLTGEEIYRIPVETFLKNLLTAQATPKGLFWVRKWGPNRYAANVAYMVMAAATLTPPIPKMDVYIEWAEKQIHLLLGDIGRSYVSGFGKNYPPRIHHRSSACQPYPAPCTRNTFYTQLPNYYILQGGLVGGPDQREMFTDDRKHYEQTEVACDYNAGFQGTVAGLKHHAMRKRKPPMSSLQSNFRRWFG